jgi:hypothetical protein
MKLVTIALYQMDTRGKTKNLVVGCAALVILGALAAGIGWILWRAVVVLAPQLNAGWAAALATGIGSLLTLALTKLLDRMWQIEQQHRHQKIPIYEEFMAFLFRVFLGQKTGESIGQEEMVRFATDFTRKLIVWGSDGVIREYGAFRKQSQADPSGLALAYQLEQVLFAIRRDIGHRNSGLRRGSLLALFINDLPVQDADRK